MRLCSALYFFLSRTKYEYFCAVHVTIQQLPFPQEATTEPQARQTSLSAAFNKTELIVDSSVELRGASKEEEEKKREALLNGS